MSQRSHPDRIFGQAEALAAGVVLAFVALIVWLALSWGSAVDSVGTKLTACPQSQTTVSEGQPCPP